MSRFRNLKTGVVVSVDDRKDERFAVGFEPVDEAGSPEKAPAKKAPSKSNDK